MDCGFRYQEKEEPRHSKTQRTAPGQQYSLVNTVGSSQHMFSVDESSTAHVHHGPFLPLENSRLPRVLAELCVTLRELRGGVLDAAQQSLSVACAAGVLVGAGGGAEDWAAAAHVVKAAGAVLGGEAVELALRGGREPLVLLLGGWGVTGRISQLFLVYIAKCSLLHFTFLSQQ